RLRDLTATAERADGAVRVETTLLPEHQRRWEQERAGAARGVVWAVVGFHCPLDGDLRVASESVGGRAGYRGKEAPAWIGGPTTKALRFDGKPDTYVDAGPTGDFSHTNAFSYGAFVRPRGDGACLSKMDDAAAFRGFDLLVGGGKVTVHLVHSWPDNAIKV